VFKLNKEETIMKSTIYTTFYFFLVLLLQASAFGAFPIFSRSASNNDIKLRTTTSSTKSTSTTKTNDPIVDELLIRARKAGPVGSLASETTRAELLELAKQLSKLRKGRINNPAKQSLRGVHTLVYSAAPGASSGRLFGPIYGKVTQEFLRDGKAFINVVRIGPIQISLQAELSTKDATTSIVEFKKSRFKIFGNTVSEKEISGEGTWKYLYMGTYDDENGQTKLLRVMETPSIFIIEQPISP